MGASPSHLPLQMRERKPFLGRIIAKKRLMQQGPSSQVYQMSEHLMANFSADLKELAIMRVINRDLDDDRAFV